MDMNDPRLQHQALWIEKRNVLLESRPADERRLWWGTQCTSAYWDQAIRDLAVGPLDLQLIGDAFRMLLERCRHDEAVACATIKTICTCMKCGITETLAHVGGRCRHTDVMIDSEPGVVK